jgi:MFS family permease
MLADRFGPRLVCATGMVFIAAGLLASSFAHSMATIYLAWGAGLGVGIGLVYAPSIASVPPWFVRRRAFAAGIASAGIGVGTLALPLLATAAIAALGWRQALQALAGGVLVVGIGATLLLRRAPTRAAPGSAAAGMTLQEALRNRRFWWMYAACVLAAPAMFIPFAHVSAAARDLGIGDARAVGLVGLIGVGSIVGRFAIGGLADRLGRIASIALLEASLGACYLLWLGAGGYVALAIFALWLGLSYGGIVSLMPAICMDLFGARAVASILGALYSGAAFGNLLGPVVAGAVFDRTGSYGPVIWACLVLSMLSAIASAQLLRDRRPIY